MQDQSRPAGAVFLSYASEDAEAAARICEALRAAGVEVWFDRSELRGGDAWDAQIKKQIHDCALFVPLISAHTNARIEGYFRGEWNLATRRLVNRAHDAAFLMPVVVDETREADARVPEEFLRAQWTWLPGGETPPAFARRARQLLGLDPVPVPTAKKAAMEAIKASAQSPGSAQPRATLLVRRFGLPIIALLAILGSGALWYFQGVTDAPAEKTVPGAALPAVADARPSIAVLPFENRSQLKDDAYFVDGVHDDILTQLSKISSLRVISRTSVERFRSSELSIKQIAEQLGVASVLEGGVQRAGETVRINVQLINAQDDAHLWADSYDRKLTAANIFEIQSEIANAIAGALKTSLNPAEQGRLAAIPTQSLPAWQQYQRGKQRLATRNSAGLVEAEGHFRKAVALDPTFALAWVGIADAVAHQSFYAGRPFEAAIQESEQAVARALKLNPDLAEAWTSAGNNADARQQFEDAVQMFNRAIALNPNYSTAYQWLSDSLIDLGRYEEALTAAERAVALDPLSAVINAQLGFAREYVGRFDDALDAHTQAVAIDPTMAAGYSSVGQTLTWGFGRFDKAAPWFMKAAALDSGNPLNLDLLAYLYWELDDDAEAERWLARSRAITEENQVSKALAALLHLDRKEIALARKYAQESADLDSTNLGFATDIDLHAGAYAQARARYVKAFPELFDDELPALNIRTAYAIVDLALVLQRAGEEQRATVLLDHGEAYFRTRPRMGNLGIGVNDVRIHAIRGDKSLALAKLREAEQAGWRYLWRYYREYDSSFASIRNEPEFKAIFADIERDIARQRTNLAARPKDAPLEIVTANMRPPAN